MQVVKTSYEKLINFWLDAKIVALDGGRTISGGSEPLVYDFEIATIMRFEPIMLIGSNDVCEMLLCHVDAAWKNEERAAAGWITTTDNIHFTKGESVKLRALTPLQAELHDILLALKWAMGKGFLHLWIKSDCLQAVTQIGDVTPIHSKAIMLI